MSIDSDYLRQIGKRVRDTRRYLDLTQTELAERAGCSLTTIVSIEKGTAQMKVLLLVRLCEALDVDANFLLGRAPQSFVSEDGYAYVTTRGYVGKEQE